MSGVPLAGFALATAPGHESRWVGRASLPVLSAGALDLRALVALASFRNTRACEDLPSRSLWLVRGEVFIAPVAPVPSDGSLIDPATGLFWASWQDEGESAALEDVELVGADVAIAWGRERSESVWIRLGNRGDTYFFAGSGMQPESDDEPIPDWPPAGPPPGGWWEPPTCPTLPEVERVAAEVTSGIRSAKDAALWAWDRMYPSITEGAPSPIVEALHRLIEAGGETGLKPR
jgi:hypothetical protein